MRTFSVLDQPTLRATRRRVARRGGSAVAGLLLAGACLTASVAGAQGPAAPSLASAADNATHSDHVGGSSLGFVGTDPTGLDLGIGVHAGTLGFGADVSKLIVGHLGVRASLNYVGFSLNHEVSGVQYSGNLRWLSFPILLDLYPSSRGSFRITGGIVINKNRLTGTGVPDAGGTITINHDSYTAAQVGTLTGSATYPNTGPYIGFGIGTPAHSSSFSFMLDFGVLISTPNVALSATGAATNPMLASDLAAQQATTETSVRKYLKIYPVMSFGPMIRF